MSEHAALTIHTTDDPLAWDALVAQMPYSSPLQGWGWGEVKRRSGWQPLRLAFVRDGQPIAAAQILRRKGGGLGLLYCPRGPALRDLADLDDIAQALRRWAGRSDVSIKIEPPAAIPSGETMPASLGLFHYTSETVQPEHTVLLDLSLGADGLLKNMHQMAKRNTKTAIKLGCVGVADGDFEAFWGLFSETNTRSQLRQHSRDYYQAVLTECNQYGGKAAIVTARFEGEPLAAGLVIGLGREMDYLYGGSTRERERAEGDRDPKASNGFYWGMMDYGIGQGFKHLDLFGIPRVLSEDKHSYGVYQFKERLGGRKVHYPAYELSLNPLAGLVNKALRLRRDIMNYRARGTTQDIL
jgi:lipid II:glycine glycyltransferase (peptidoglycan interpeptide bridge formation enzyme)